METRIGGVVIRLYSAAPLKFRCGKGVHSVCVGRSVILGPNVGACPDIRARCPGASNMTVLDRRNVHVRRNIYRCLMVSAVLATPFLFQRRGHKIYI